MVLLLAGSAHAGLFTRGKGGAGKIDARKVNRQLKKITVAEASGLVYDIADQTKSLPRRIFGKLISDEQLERIAVGLLPHVHAMWHQGVARTRFLGRDTSYQAVIVPPEEVQTFFDALGRIRLHEQTRQAAERALRKMARGAETYLSTALDELARSISIGKMAVGSLRSDRIQRNPKLHQKLDRISEELEEKIVKATDMELRLGWIAKKHPAKLKQGLRTLSAQIGTLRHLWKRLRDFVDPNTLHIASGFEADVMPDVTNKYFRPDPFRRN